MIIGLHGESRAGKDAVAKIMAHRFGFEMRVFSDAICKILYDLNPQIEDPSGVCHNFADLVDEYGWDDIREVVPESVQYMIRLGQSSRRHVDPLVWVGVTLRDPPENLVISGVRQPNEVEAIRALGGQMWEITRPGTMDQGMDRLLKDVKFDVTIDNAGTLEDLEQAVSLAYWNAL